jgi:hypothetical protein
MRPYDQLGKTYWQPRVVPERVPRAPSPKFEQVRAEERGPMVEEAGIKLTRATPRRRGCRAGQRRGRRAQAQADAGRRAILLEREEAARVIAAVETRTEYWPFTNPSGSLFAPTETSDRLTTIDREVVETLRRVAHVEAINESLAPGADVGSRFRCERCGGPLNNGACADHRACVRAFQSRSRNLIRGRGRMTPRGRGIRGA